jgi:hypothetical protein
MYLRGGPGGGLLVQAPQPVPDDRTVGGGASQGEQLPQVSLTVYACRSSRPRSPASTREFHSLAKPQGRGVRAR